MSEDRAMKDLVEKSQESDLSSGAKSSASVLVERLEYGKVCLSSEGPIEPGTDHQQLGRSAGFPSELLPFADPSVLGHVSQPFEELPAACSHSTVLRPVLTGKAISSVLCRIRQRPEDGEGGRHRLYTLARYVTSASDAANPLVLLAAVQQEPLQSLTRRQIGAALSSYSVPGPLPSEPNEEAGFAREALAWVLSGIPVALAGPVSEKTFFDCVAALSFLLPAGVTRLISAGWGVGPSIAGQCMLSYSNRPAPHAAIFSTLQNRWIAPSRMFVIRTGERTEEAFDESRLSAGRSYIELMELPEPCSPLEPDAGSLGLPALPGLTDAATIAALRSPGLAARDQLRLHVLANWLRTGKTDPALSARPPRLVNSRSILEALLITLEAFHDDTSRVRAQEMFLQLMQSNPLAGIEQLLQDKPKGHLAWLIVCLLRDLQRESAEAFLLCARSGEMRNLADSVSRLIGAYLDRGLSHLHSETARLHCELFSLPELPQVYARWVEAKAADLAFYIESTEVQSQPLEALENIKRIASENPTVMLLIKWVKQQPLAPEDGGVILQMETKFREALASRALGLWKNAAAPGFASRRELAFSWLNSLTPFTYNDVVLGLLLREVDAPRSPQEWQALAAEVERKGIPPSQLQLISLLTLRYWPEILARIYTNPDPWSSVTSLWPEPAQLLLRTKRRGSKRSENSMENLVFSGPFDARDLQQLFQREDSRWPPAAASLLWSWTQNSYSSIPAETTAAAICRWLGGTSENFTTQPQPNDLSLVIVLVRGCPNLVRSLKAQQLWTSAELGWQIGLLLDLFPEENLVPSIRQLTEMVPHRAWLRKHLTNPGVRRSRAEHFELAMQEAFQLPYFPKRKWDDAMSLGLWAAFHGVPVELQGNLSRAIRLYAKALTEQGEFCRRYLESCNTCQAARCVLHFFVLPLFSKANVGQKDVIFILRSIERQIGIREARRQFWHTSEPQIRDLNTTNGSWIARDPLHVLLAGWMRLLLQDIVRLAPERDRRRWMRDFYRGARLA